jgi:nitrate reductase delta subunit
MRLADHDLAVVDQAASVLLQYPDQDEEARQRLQLVRAAVDTLPACTAQDRLAAFLQHVEGASAIAWAQEYVEAFDFRRRSCLYLTYYTDGDTRRRGVALGRLKVRYRKAGLELAGGELPDFLPVVLEFCASTGERDTLVEHRPALELIRLALEEAGSAYALVVQALCATLPGPSPRDREAVLALAASGPPREEVGLDAYPTTPAGPRGGRP